MLVTVIYMKSGVVLILSLLLVVGCLVGCLQPPMALHRLHVN
jgi:hypothetical protein